MKDQESLSIDVKVFVKRPNGVKKAVAFKILAAIPANTKLAILYCLTLCWFAPIVPCYQSIAIVSQYG